MLPLLLVALLGGTPFDLPASVPETLMPGSDPAIANAGTNSIVVWKDGRTEALFGRVERVRTPAPELWWNRVRSPGNTLSLRSGVPGCQTSGGLSFAVTANPATGRAWAGWLEEPTPMTSRLHLAILDADGGVRCLGPSGAGQGNAGDLSLGWVGTKFFAVWREGSASKLAWCDSNAVCGPTGSLSPVSGTEHSLGGGVRDDGGVFVGAESSGSWLLTRAEGQTGGGLPAGINPATAVAVDPFGQIVGVLNAGTWEMTFTFGTQPIPIGRPLSTVSIVPSNTALLVFESATPTVRAYPPMGGMVQSAVFGPIGTPVMTRENAGARMAFINNASVSTLLISASTSQVNTELAGGIAVARPPQRNPSLAWAGDRWLMAYEEWFDGGWRPLATSVFPDAGGVIQDGVFGGYDSPAFVTAPDGGLFVRLSTTSTTETRPVLVTGSGISLGPVGFSSSRALSGTVTNAKAVHWSTNFLAPGTSSTSRFSASSAVIPGGLLIPQRVAGTEISIVHLADTASTLDGGPVRLMSMADPSAPISIASTFDGRGWVVLLGWYESGSLVLTGFQPDGGGINTTSLTVPIAPNRGLAIAPWDTEFAVVTSAGTEVILNRVTKAGAIVGGVGGIINNLNEVPGDPVVAVAPTGHVAVAWPALDEVSRSVAVRVSLFDPPGRDGGAAGGGMAGGGMAGGGMAGGGMAGGGTAGGGMAGGGMAGGGMAGGGMAGGGMAGGGMAGGGMTGGGMAGGGAAGGGMAGGGMAGGGAAGGATAGGTAGGGAAGGGAAGGGSADAGNATVDAGQAGGAPVIFASTCGCTSTSELSWMLGLLVAALARRRAHRR